MDSRKKRVMAARALAVLADAVQLGLLPLFVEGALSVVNDVLDVAVAIALIALVGWHWAFLPAFLAELVPGLGLVPTWTAATLLATSGPGPLEPAASGQVKPLSSEPGRDVPPQPPPRVP